MPIVIDRDRPSFPPAELIAHPEIRAAVEAHGNAQSATFAAGRDVTALEQERAAAVEADRQSYADALQRNARARDPGTPATDAHDAKVAAARRHRDALAEVESRALAALIECVETNGDAWAASVEADAEAKRVAFAAAVEHVKHAFGDLSHVRGLAHYLRDRDGAPNVYRGDAGGHVAMERSPDSHRNVEALIDALQRFGEPRGPPVERPGYVGGMRLVAQGEDAA